MTQHRLLAIAVVSASLYLGLALAGDLRHKLPVFLAVHVVLCGLGLLAWMQLRRGAGSMRLMLTGALVFRVVAALGQPALSDDVYRYVWDGRVWLHGAHPYEHAPADPELAGLRDDDWVRINHPELETIYPPLAQVLFLGLAATGAGPFGFKLAMGLLDFAVVLLLGGLLRRLDLPADRLVLYAWNPLAVMESAGSGHVEPLGVAMVVLAVAWIIDRRPVLSTLAVAGGFHAKLLPVILVPGYLKRWGPKVALLLSPAALIVPWVPFAINGPAIGAGTFAYAGSWEHNAVAFPLIQLGFERLDAAAALKGWLAALQQRFGDGALPWEFLYRHVWPRDLATLVATGLALAWLAHLVLRRRPGPARFSFLALGGVLLLAPTLHPWYVLWVLPFAAAYLSWGWLAFAALVPLAYWSEGGDVTWSIRAVEYLPPLAVSAWLSLPGRRRRRLAVTSGE